MSEIKILEEQITRYAQEYYSGEASVSDTYFDSLVENLRKLDPTNPILHKTGWGFTPTSKKKFPHKYNLYIGSLDKVHDPEEIPASISNTDPLNFETVRISAKLDGLSVVSYYKDGILVQALTRGDGTQGIDVTDKIKAIDPSIIDLNRHGYAFTGAVRGEVVISNETWDTDPSLLLLRAENPSANQRNFASGVLNRDDVTPDTYKLKYLVYKILACPKWNYSDNTNIETISDMLYNMGFQTVPAYQTDSAGLHKMRHPDFENFYKEFKSRYPCDGLVLSTLKDDLQYDEIAYKFEAEAKKVTVTRVTWNATRTGRIVPLVWFDPIELSGAMVQKATGFNAKFIQDNKINVGTVLSVARSGEVIPDIKAVITPSETPALISICPKCGTQLTWNGVDLFCNSENESQLAYNFISNIATIDGVGYSLYMSVVNMFHLNTLADLAKFGEMIVEDRGLVYSTIRQNTSGDITRAKVCSIIDMLCSPIDPIKFLLGCNIKGFGEANIQAVLKGYPEFLKDIQNGTLSYDKFIECKGAGDALYTSITANLDRIKILMGMYNIEDYEIKSEQPTKFKVAITGTLSMKRADFDKLLKDKGIEQSGSFKEIKYLITNNPNSTSSKMKSAIANNVEIINEEEFTKRYLTD